jgi:hypothetical protein
METFNHHMMTLARLIHGLHWNISGWREANGDHPGDLVGGVIGLGERVGG